MHVLFLSQVLPYPLDAGPKTRAYYVLRHLAAAGHRLTLLTFTRRSDRPEYLDHLAGYCQTVHGVPIERSRAKNAWHLLRSMMSTSPFLIARDWTPAMAQRVRELARDDQAPIDAVHADQLWMAPYALLARATAGPNRPLRLVLDQHNAVFQIPRRLAQHESNPLKRAVLALEAHKLTRYEADVCGRFDAVVWVTNEDRQALDSASKDGKPPRHPVIVPSGQPAGPPATRPVEATTIPICVDPQSTTPIARAGHARRVTFLGGLHWPPNADGVMWFVQRVWPQVLREAPDAVLTVIGKDPPARLLSGREQVANLEITGYVPDVIPYLQETAAFIVPLHAGGGMRVKILDAWCWGLPVVSTSIGAEGIRVRDGDNALLADAPDAFAHAVVRLLRDPTLAAAVGASGRQTVEKEYDWRKVYTAWDRLYAL